MSHKKAIMKVELAFNSYFLGKNSGIKVYHHYINVVSIAGENLEDKNNHLTHFSQMELPIIIIWVSPLSSGVIFNFHVISQQSSTKQTE